MLRTKSALLLRVAVAGTLGLLLLPGVLRAQEGTTVPVDQTQEQASLELTPDFDYEPAHNFIEKLGRGGVNILTFWAEVPAQGYARFNEKQSAGLLRRLGASLGGIVSGLKDACLRVGLGAYEVISFPFPVPSGYRPVYSSFGLSDTVFR